MRGGGLKEAVGGSQKPSKFRRKIPESIGSVAERIRARRCKFLGVVGEPPVCDRRCGEFVFPEYIDSLEQVRSRGAIGGGGVFEFLYMSAYLTRSVFMYSLPISGAAETFSSPSSSIPTPATTSTGFNASTTSAPSSSCPESVILLTKGIKPSRCVSCFSIEVCGD